LKARRATDGGAVVCLGEFGESPLANGQSDVHGHMFSSGNNLIGIANPGHGFTNGNKGDVVGAPASPVSAGLLSLTENETGTWSHPLSRTSPAINRGSNTVLIYRGDPYEAGSPMTSPPPATDQRGLMGGKFHVAGANR